VIFQNASRDLDAYKSAWCLASAVNWPDLSRETKRRFGGLTNVDKIEQIKP
jgi:hypothetical protein